MYEQLQDLSKSQQSINQETDQMMSFGQTPGMQQYLQQLAAEQQMIQQAIEDIIKSGSEKGISDQLKDILGDAEKSKKDLAGGKLTDKTKESQRKFLRKLLDAQRSLKIKDYEKERKSETAQDFDSVDPEDLKKELLKIKKRTVELKGDKEKFPGQYKELVEKYLKALQNYGERYQIDDIKKETNDLPIIR